MTPYFVLFPARFDADNLNKQKNMASKVIGEKMKVRENDETLFQRKNKYLIRNYKFLTK